MTAWTLAVIIVVVIAAVVPVLLVRRRRRADAPEPTRAERQARQQAMRSGDGPPHPDARYGERSM